MRKRLLAQIKAHRKLGSYEIFAAMDEDLRGMLDSQIAGLEGQIEQIVAADESLNRTVDILHSALGSDLSPARC